MELDRRLQRAGRLLDVAAAESSERQRPVGGRSRKGRLAGAALALVLVAAGGLIARASTGQQTQVNTGAATVPAVPAFVDVQVTVTTDPPGAARIEVIDPRFDSLPTAGDYQISLSLDTTWAAGSDIAVGPWQTTGPLVIGNQEGQCEIDRSICNTDAAELIRHDIGNIVPLFFDAATLPLGDVTASTVLQAADGQTVTVTLDLLVSEGQRPTQTTMTTTTTRP